MTDRETSNEEGLQSDLKGGDWAELLCEFASVESLDEMSQRAVGWLVLVLVLVAGRFAALAFRRWADAGQGGTDGGLSVLETLPDTVGSGIAHVAGKAFEGFAFVPSICGLFEEPPELSSGEEETFDFVGDPNAEGTTATLASTTVATKSAVRPDGFAANVLALETFEESMSVNGTDGLAMRAWRELEIKQKLITLVLRATDFGAHDGHAC